MDIPTFTISEHAARTEGQVMSTFEEVSGMHGIGKDVAIISWLPPRYFATLDDAATPSNESFFSRASLLAWQEEVVRQDEEYINGNTVDDDYDDTSMFSKLEELRYYEKEKLRAEWDRLTTERRIAIERAPFAYTTQGIVVVNWLGSHAHWERAWEAALRVVRSTVSLEIREHNTDRELNHLIKSFLYGGHLDHKWLVTIRHELSALSGERHLVPDTYRLTSQLMGTAFKTNPNARLNPFYVLTAIENEDLARLVMQRLCERMVQPWLRALAQASDEEGRPWISLESKHKLLALVDQGRFFLFEFLPGLKTAYHSPGTVAYAPVLSSRGWTPGRPLGIGIALRFTNIQDSDFFNIDALFNTILHELGHVLDGGDPMRKIGDDTEFQHQPGVHDRNWKRAYQYTLNLAFRLGLMKNEASYEQGENWTMADFDENFDNYVDWHKATEMDTTTSVRLRHELLGTAPHGTKREREEEGVVEDESSSKSSRTKSLYLS